MNKNIKSLFLLTSIALLSVCCIGLNKTSKETIAIGDTVTTYLVLSPIGEYQGEKGENYPDLYLENTIKFIAPVGSELPDSDDVTSIASSQGTFTSWVRYDGLGSPSKYSTVPNENGAILYANFKNAHISLLALTLSGTPLKTSYEIGSDDEVFDPTGLTVMAKYSDDSTANVTSYVKWESLAVGMTSVVGSYTFAGITKTVTVNGIEVVRQSNLTKIYLNAGGPTLWEQSGAWFAAYCWTGTGGAMWVELTKSDSYYVMEIDLSVYFNLIFVRFSNMTETMSWADSINNVWNKTIDLTFDGNCFTITGWEITDGIWSTI